MTLPSRLFRHKPNGEFALMHSDGCITEIHEDLIDVGVGRNAVRKVAKHLYDPAGGIIAQFEFGLGANPETAKAILDEWLHVDTEAQKG